MTLLWMICDAISKLGIMSAICVLFFELRDLKRILSPVQPEEGSRDSC